MEGAHSKPSPSFNQSLVGDTVCEKDDDVWVGSEYYDNELRLDDSILWKDAASIEAAYATGGKHAAVKLAHKFALEDFVSEKEVNDKLKRYAYKMSAQLMPVKHKKLNNIAPDDKLVTCINVKPGEISKLRIAGWKIIPMTFTSGKPSHGEAYTKDYNMLPLTGPWNMDMIDEEAWFANHEALVSKNGFKQMNNFVERVGLVEPSHCIKLWFNDGVLVKKQQKPPQLHGKEHPDLAEFGFVGFGDTFTVSTATSIDTEVGKIGIDLKAKKCMLLPFNPFNTPTIISKENFTKKYPDEDMQAVIKNTFASAQFQLPLVHSILWKDEASINASYATGGTQEAVKLVRIFTEGSVQQVQDALRNWEHEKSAQFMPIKHEKFGNTAPESKQVTCIAIEENGVSHLRDAGWEIFPITLTHEKLYNMLPLTGIWNQHKFVDHEGDHEGDHDDEFWFADHEALVAAGGFKKMNKFVQLKKLVERIAPNNCIKLWFNRLSDKGGVLVKMHKKQPQVNGNENIDIFDGWSSHYTVSTATDIYTEVGKIGEPSSQKDPAAGKFVLLPFNPFNKSAIISEEDLKRNYPSLNMKEFIENQFQSALYSI